VQTIFTAFPDLRAGMRDIVLYDITLIHPNVDPARGQSETDFLGGRITETGVRFRYAPAGDWVDEYAFFLGEPINYNIELVFNIDDNIITDISYNEWFLRS
jgi:hypothetical protein